MWGEAIPFLALGAPQVTDALGRGRAPTVWHPRPGPGAWQSPGLTAPDSSRPTTSPVSTATTLRPHASCLMIARIPKLISPLMLPLPSFQLNLEKSFQSLTLFLTHAFSLSYKLSGLLRGPNSSAQQPRLCAHACMHLCFFVSVCVSMWVCASVCVDLCICIYVCETVSEYAWKCVHLCVHICV